MMPSRGKWMTAIPTAALLTAMPFCAAQPMDGAGPASLRGLSLARPSQHSASRDSVSGNGPGPIGLHLPGGGPNQALFTAADARRMRIRTALFTEEDAKRMVIRTALFTEADARRMVLRNAAWTGASRQGPAVEQGRPPSANAYR